MKVGDLVMWSNHWVNLNQEKEYGLVVKKVHHGYLVFWNDETYTIVLMSLIDDINII
tara:strand:- start:54218 stop:54388 length:171 start_codon:yes stop_codon:yes gene_type:complete